MSDPASLLTPHASRSFDVAQLRASEFPWTSKAVYLNAASTGPLPASTARVLADWAQRRTTPYLIPDPEILGTLTESRKQAAALLNCDAGEIALATNTSVGINVAARSLPLNEGDVVVVSDREFPANVYPWLRLRSEGVTVELAPVTADGWPDEAYLLERVADPRVRVLAVSLVQFSNGYTVDLARLSAATRAHNTYLVVDAIQGLGQMPVDLQQTPVDFLASGAQKWLLSPWGSGFMYVRRELIPKLEPPFAGWMAFEGTDDFSRLCDYDDTWRDDARRFEVLTYPVQDMSAMNVSLGLLRSLGIDAIARHLQVIEQPLLEWAERRGLALASPLSARRSGIVCVRVPDGRRLYGALKAAGVTVSLREGALRFSPHCYNNHDDLERAVAVLQAEL